MPFISWLNIFANVCCVLACFDFVNRIDYLHNEEALAFCRTGQVTSTSVKLLCRNPTPDVMTMSVCSPQSLCYDVSQASSTEHDFLTLFYLSHLSPDTAYTYSASNGHHGSFKTQRRECDMQTFSLISSSCMKPNWPYSPVNHALRIQGLEHLASYLSVTRKIPEMMLFLGDFICESTSKPDMLNRRF